MQCLLYYASGDIYNFLEENRNMGYNLFAFVSTNRSFSEYLSDKKSRMNNIIFKWLINYIATLQGYFITTTKFKSGDTGHSTVIKL